MAEEKIKQEDKKVNPKEEKTKTGKEEKLAEAKEKKTEEEKKEEVKPENKEEKKPETKEIDKEKTKQDDKKAKKEQSKEIPKKEEAIANGIGLHISPKHGAYICSFIKNKTIDNALKDLDMVLRFKKPIPFKGEIPHRKGRGMMSGRYPVKAVKIIIPLLKSLKGNAMTNGLDIDKTIIRYSSASFGSRPARRGGREGKRTNIVLKAREMNFDKEKTPGAK